MDFDRMVRGGDGPSYAKGASSEWYSLSPNLQPLVMQPLGELAALGIPIPGALSRRKPGPKNAWTVTTALPVRRVFAARDNSAKIPLDLRAEFTARYEMFQIL